MLVLNSKTGVDRILLKDGRSIEGIYIGGSSKFIFMEVKDETRRIPFKNIISLSIEVSGSD